MHPIVEATNPNEEQRPAVLDRGRDIVVTAGAGTGKTRTLVSRYLSLLAEDVPIRSIVAITFTRKAAREMRNRVRESMREFIEKGGSSAEEQRLWVERYNQLDAARIGTIHSLSTEILRAHPAEAGVDPRFEVLDEGEAGLLLAQAYDQGLSWAADDEQAVRLFSFIGEWKLTSIIEELMKQRLDSREALTDQPEPLWPHWEGLLVPRIAAFVDNPSVIEAFDELGALEADGTLEKARAEGDALVPHLVELLKTWRTILSHRARADWVAISAKLHPLRQNMMLKGKKSSWSPADPKAIIKVLRLDYDEAMGTLKDKHFNLMLDQQWANLYPALSRLFEQVNGSYLEAKGRGQTLDYDDLESGALRLLSAYPAVRARWQQEIGAILVDEFQDTNSRQRELVRLLSGDAGKLFIVGDAKQSIYRFRGADVAVFRAERDRIDQGEGTAFELATSYRAHEDLLQGLNDLLRPVLGEHDDPERPWREPFSPLDPFREEPRNGITAPFIELHLTVGSKGGGALDRAAAALADHLLEIVNGEGSEIGFGDVAILCRASTSFGYYETALDEAGIPFLTVAGRGFYDRPEIRDLLNMLQAVADPSDDLAMVGLLRSPVVGYSDFDLYRLIESWNETEREQPLWEMVRESTEAKGRWLAGIVGDLHNRAGRIPVASVLDDFVSRTDYKAALLQSGNARAARNVAKLLVDAHNSDIISIGAFLTYVQGLRSGPAREGEAPVTSGDAVRIMTIHGAKGLEFPVVVIGDVNYSRRVNTNLLIDADLGVVPKLSDNNGAGSAMFQLLLERERDQEEAESDRLLYVAATRAQEKLILSGCILLNQDGKPIRLAGWMKKLGDPLGLSSQQLAYDEEGGRARRTSLEVGESEVGCVVYEPKYIPSGRAAPIPVVEAERNSWIEAMVEPLVGAEDKLKRPDDEADHEWTLFGGDRPSRASGKIIGQLVHEALAEWRFPGPEFDAWLRARAGSHGLSSEKQVADALARAKTLLKRFQQHELFAAMDSADRRLTEIPFDRPAGRGAMVHGRIDALFLADGKWFIVDYKTDEIRDDEDLKQVLYVEGYLNQINGYVTAVRQLTGRSPLAMLCFLDYKGGVYLYPEQKALWAGREGGA